MVGFRSFQAVSKSQPSSVVLRVATLVQEGALRQACAALLQNPPVSPTDEVVSALRLLHRAPSGTPALAPFAAPAAPTAEVDHVRKALHSCPSTSGAGRSGLRPSHIRDAMRPASADLLLRLLFEVVSLRPIAIAESIRRLASKVAVDLTSDRARTILEPLQLGVKIPNGCEATVHVTRQWFHRHSSDPSKVALSVDISNAFNTVHRSAVSQAVRTHFPSLSPWVDCCYRLRFGHSPCSPGGAARDRELLSSGHWTFAFSF